MAQIQRMGVRPHRMPQSTAKPGNVSGSNSSAKLADHKAAADEAVARANASRTRRIM